MNRADIKAMMAEIAPVIREFTQSVVEPLITRIKVLETRGAIVGADGKDGRDGADGKDGKDAEPVTREQIVDAVLSVPDALADAVARHLASHPPGAGAAGKDGRDGADGKDGKDGRDGVGLAGAIIDRSGCLILTLTDGTTRELGQVVGKDGRDGKDGERGRDGFSLKDFDTELLPDGRTVLLKFGSGDTSEVHELCFPIVLDQGVWKEGLWRQGDGVTWAGSFWIAQKDTTSKPDTPDSDWRLAVKRGRDGRDGK